MKPLTKCSLMNHFSTFAPVLAQKLVSHKTQGLEIKVPMEISGKQMLAGFFQSKQHAFWFFITQ